jgi:hypothetical protein
MARESKHNAPQAQKNSTGFSHCGAQRADGCFASRGDCGSNSCGPRHAASLVTPVRERRAQNPRVENCLAADDLLRAIRVVSSAIRVMQISSWNANPPSLQKCNEAAANASSHARSRNLSFFTNPLARVPKRSFSRSLILAPVRDSGMRVANASARLEFENETD